MLKSASKLIRESTILEAIKLDKDLCLLVAEQTFVLYDKAAAKVLDDADTETLEPHILAVAALRDNEKHHCWELESMIAEKGYGPTLVFMIIAWTGKEGLVPDTRSGKVSQEAKNMFKEFGTKGGKGAEYVIAEDIDGDHEDDYMNKKYRAKKRINLKIYMQNSTKAIGQDKYGQKRDMLWETGDTMLSQKMRTMYT